MRLKERRFSHQDTKKYIFQQGTGVTLYIGTILSYKYVSGLRVRLYGCRVTQVP